MIEQIENPMVIDWWWERFEPGGSLSDRTKNNEMSAYEDAENMEGKIRIWRLQPLVRLWRISI